MELYQALITLDGWTFLAQICNLMIQLLTYQVFKIFWISSLFLNCHLHFLTNLHLLYIQNLLF